MNSRARPATSRPCRLSQAVAELETAARTRSEHTTTTELGERVTRELASCEQMIESLLRGR